MPNILVFGATGYIGSAVASSLLRSGQHVVYGLARTPASAKSLSSQEIIPILGDFTNTTAWASLIASTPIDIVINCADSKAFSQQTLDLLITIGKERLEAGKNYGIKSPKLGYVYVSGTWVHGSHLNPINDLMPVGKGATIKPATLVSWRADHETDILAASSVLDVIIVRPPPVYGRSGWLWNSLFAPVNAAIKENAPSVSVPADPECLLGLCHVDDIASGIHAAAEKLSLLAGTGVHPVFDLVASHESMRAVVESAANGLGFKGEVKLVGAGDNLFLQALSCSFNGSNGRAQQLLGWVPKRIGYVAGMQAYIRAWEAVQE